MNGSTMTAKSIIVICAASTLVAGCRDSGKPVIPSTKEAMVDHLRRIDGISRYDCLVKAYDADRDCEGVATSLLTARSHPSNYIGWVLVFVPRTEMRWVRITDLSDQRRQWLLKIDPAAPRMTSPETFTNYESGKSVTIDLSSTGLIACVAIPSFPHHELAAVARISVLILDADMKPCGKGAVLEKAPEKRNFFHFKDMKKPSSAGDSATLESN
jgi:hypothetical protein